MDLGDWEKAGRIASEALNHGKSLIKEGALLRDVCDEIEGKIIDLGGDIAFPAQISLNETAAHYCPDIDDETVFKDQIVCLDVGAHVNGAIGDNALTVDLSGKYTDLVKASLDALNSAIKVLRPGITLGEIGKTIQEAIESYGYNPVRNLSGHGLGPYQIHTPPTIPNFDTKDNTELIEGQTIAIEPFATNGDGFIHEKGVATVFSMTGRKPVRSNMVRQVYAVVERFDELPFTSRWLKQEFSQGQVNFALKQFEQLEIMKKYPPLVEKTGGLVSQAEHSLIVRDKPVILTKKGDE